MVVSVYTSAIFDCFDDARLAVLMADKMKNELIIETFNKKRLNAKGFNAHPA